MVFKEEFIFVHQVTFMRNISMMATAYLTPILQMLLYLNLKNEMHKNLATPYPPLTACTDIPKYMQGC